MLISEVRRAMVGKLGARPVSGAKHDRLAVYDPDNPKRKLCTVGFSRGGRSIDDEDLLRHIAVNEVRLHSLRDFKDFVGCTLDGPTALEQIRDSIGRHS